MGDGQCCKKILLNVPTNILVIPPMVELVFPSNISVLIENNSQQKTSNLEKLTAFNRYISNFNVFINFVLFADTQETLEQEKTQSTNIKVSLNRNFTFTFIVQAQKKFINFLKYIEQTHCNAAVVTWSDNSDFLYESQRDSVSFPSSPHISVLFSKKREPIENVNKLFTPLI